jgi:acyl-CoA synthetase (AMP-forming)/AMP-acid ligase II
MLWYDHQPCCLTCINQKSQMSYACFKVSAIVSPLNPAYTPAQVISALKHVSAKCFVLSAEIMLPYKQPKSAASLLSAVLREVKQYGFVSILVDNSTGQARKSEFEVTAEYEQLLSSNQGRRLPPQDHLQNYDIATIQFTSGTTSAPKAACLTHRNILNNGLFVGLGMELTELDIVCCPPPLYHCFGLVLGIIATMNYGAPLCI